MTDAEHIQAIWTIDGHAVPFMAHLTFAGQRTEVCDTVVSVDVEILCCDLSQSDRSWLQRQSPDRGGMRADLERAACDAYNLARLSERDAESQVTRSGSADATANTDPDALAALAVNQ